MKNKIPKDLSRWLKDNNKYVEFIRLINLCGYRCEDLVYKESGDYGIKKWLCWPIESKSVSYKGSSIRYVDFLNSFKLNWK
jgi:hypothetical protein